MKKKLWRLLKGLCIAVIAVSILIFGIYSLAWFAVTQQISAYINHIVQHKELIVTGDIPHFTSYPSVPEASFSGTIEHKSGLQISSPELNYRGFPTLGQVQTLEALKGLKISANFLERDLNFDYAFLQLRLPNRLPASNKKQDVQEWQKLNSPIKIYQIILKTGNIYARGDGTVFLDEDLQISADINARVVGLDIFLDELEKTQGSKSIALARNFYNMMSAVDEKTGEKYFETTLKIQKQGIFFGPMRISGLPKLVWE
jgi:hypothetical protein